jgi:hypothetical protein
MIPIRLAALFAPALLVSGQDAGGRQQVNKDGPPGLSLPLFEPEAPAGGLVYEGIEAKRLAREILPVGAERVSRAVVTRSTANPGSTYLGVSVVLTFPIRVGELATCEEPEVVVTLRYRGQSRPQKDMRLTFVDGEAIDHEFQTIRMRGRYKSLPQSLSSYKEMQDTCSDLAKDASGWTRSLSAAEFRQEEELQKILRGAIETLPMDRISCLKTDGTPCRYQREDLQNLIRTIPMNGKSQRVKFEQNRSSYIFAYSGYSSEPPAAYDITMLVDSRQNPVSVSIKFRQVAVAVW